MASSVKSEPGCGQESGCGKNGSLLNSIICAWQSGRQTLTADGKHESYNEVPHFHVSVYRRQCFITILHPKTEDHGESFFELVMVLKLSTKTLSIRCVKN